MIAQFDYMEKSYKIDSKKGPVQMRTKLPSAHLSK